MKNSIRIHAGLLATTAGCVRDTTPRIKPGTVNVAIGRATGMPKPCEFYATPDADTYAYDCLYDPKQISLADAEQWVRNQLAEQGVNVGQFINEDEDTTEATRRRMLAQWDEVAELAKQRGTHTPAVERFHNEMALLLAVAPDPAGTLDRILQVIDREHAKRLPGACTVYPGLCTSVDGEAGDQVDEHGRHYDHGGRTISVPGLEIADDPEIWAEFIHLSSSTPKIGFMGADLTPAQVREKAQQLRQFADEADALADQVDVAIAAAEQAGGNR